MSHCPQISAPPHLSPSDLISKMVLDKVEILFDF